MAFEFDLFRIWNPNFSVTLGLVAPTKTSLGTVDFEEAKLMEKFPIPIGASDFLWSEETKKW